MSATIDQLIDDTWDHLRGNLFRRAILGKPRCAELVMHAVACFPDREIVALKATKGSPLEKQLVANVEKRVATRFRGAARDPGIYGSVFLSLVLYWAITAIVQHLVVEWWRRWFDPEALRVEYGWK